MELEILMPVLQAFVHLSPFWVGKREQLPEAGKFAQKTALARMAWLDGELARRTFIAGERYTVADITAQSGLVLGKNTGTPIPAELTNLNRWFTEVTSRPTARA
jgi:glutathione S-transferase